MISPQPITALSAVPPRNAAPNPVLPPVTPPSSRVAAPVTGPAKPPTTKVKAPVRSNTPITYTPEEAHQLHVQHIHGLIEQARKSGKPVNPAVAAENHRMNEVAKAGQLNKYLTNDTTYQSQTAAINKALSDYQAQELQQENSYNTGYAQNRAGLQEQQRIGGINQDEDFGSRGMIRSGLYATDKTDFLSDYARQNSQLDQQRNDYLLNLHQGLNNYNTSQNLALQQAKQDAMNRRAIGLIGGGTPVVN